MTLRSHTRAVKIARLAVAVSFAVCAGFAWADGSDERYEASLREGSPAAVRGVAKEIFRAKGGSQKILDMMADVLAKQGATATEPHQVDANAWVCLALGKAGPARYYEVIRAVATAPTAASKLRKHCENAIEDFDDKAPDVAQYKPGTASMSKKTVVAAPAPAPQLGVAASAGATPPVSGGGSGASSSPVQKLLSSNASVRRDAAKALAEGKPSREAAEIMAETLAHDGKRKDLDGTEAEATAWMCRGIGASGDKRFYDVLLDAAAYSTSEQVSAWCNKVIESWGEPDVAQYKPGTIDLDDRRRDAR